MIVAYFPPTNNKPIKFHITSVKNQDYLYLIIKNWNICPKSFYLAYFKRNYTLENHTISAKIPIAKIAQPNNKTIKITHMQASKNLKIVKITAT